MKKIITICVLLMASVGMMAQDNTEPLETIYQKFSFTLFNKVVEDGNKNVILSPLSAQIALSMVQNGAANNTLAEIQEAMGTAGYTNEQVNAYNQQLAEQLTYRPPFNYTPSPYQTEEEARQQYEAAYPICEIANGVWSMPDIPLYDSYKNLLTTHYNAEVGNVDFGTQEGIDHINGWVNEKTHQLIPFILNEPNPNISVLLANALYFKGSWSEPFDSLNTQTEPFYLADGKTINVDMMQTDMMFRSTTTGQFNTLTIPYGYRDFSMTIFLPTEDYSIPQLTYEDWFAASNAPYKGKILKMPKFEIDGDYNLTDVFQSLGMDEAFCPGADFSQLSEMALWIDRIIQSGKITVDEKGTEAAAVTVIEMASGIPEPSTETFTVDHPFYFTIEHLPTHTILFMGRMMEISSSAGSQQGIKNITATPEANHQIYDLQGRQLRHAPAKGVYIQDGKKRVVK